MMSRGVGLVVGITGDVSGLKNSLGDAGKDVKGFGGISLATAAKVTLIGGVAIAAATGLMELGKAAAADRDEHAKLLTAVQAAGAATGDYMGVIDAAIAQGQEKAFSDSETRAALMSLVSATGNVTAATGQLAGAQDIARFAGVSLEQASDAIAKALAGQDGALRKLMPGLAKGKSATDTIALATARAAGQADKFASSADGMGARAGDAIGELGETIGEVFLPVLDAILPALIPIIQAFGKLIKAVLPVLVPLLKVVAKAFGFVVDVVSRLIGFVSDLIGWIGDLLRPIGQVIDALASLNPFGGLIKTITGGPMRMEADTGGPAPSFNAQFNIYGDPAQIEATVIRALRDYSRRNGLVTVGLAGRI
jgi:hypothetical protein